MHSDLKTLQLTAIPDVPLIRPGDDLCAVLIHAIERAELVLRSGDTIVVAQKVVSKAEDRYVYLDDVSASPRACELAAAVEKDPRLVEVILSEADEVLRYRPGLIIVAHKLGFVIANAGVDQSNVEPDGNRERVLLLPRDPDASSATLKAELDNHFHAQVGVIISDSVGRPWRIGTVGLAIGVAGLPAVRNLRGEFDLHGRPLQTSQVGLADLVASSAMLLMGECAEGTPVVLVRGLHWSDPDGTALMLLRAKEHDLFR